jgi:hypothetical protein
MQVLNLKNTSKINNVFKVYNIYTPIHISHKIVKFFIFIINYISSYYCYFDYINKQLSFCETKINTFFNLQFWYKKKLNIFANQNIGINNL